MHSITWTIRFVASFLVCIGSLALAADVNNPFQSYRIVDHFATVKDSVLVATSFFDPLPVYREESQFVIEFYPQYSSEHGFVFREYEPSRYQGILILSPNEIEVPGPIEAGDTVRVEFRVTPLRVGVVPLSIRIGGKVPPGETRHSPGGSIKADFLLGPDGTTLGLASGHVDARNASVLGPSPEQLTKGLSFFKNSLELKKEMDAYDPNGRTRAQSGAFEIRAEAMLSESAENRIQIDCTVTPFRDYDAGIGFEIGHTEALNVVAMDSSHTAPVTAEQPYDFSAQIEVEGPGTERLSFVFFTLNPDIMQTGEPNSEPGIGDLVTLYVGVNSNNEVIFITESNALIAMQSYQKYNISPIGIDPRYQHAIDHPQDESRVGKRRTVGKGHEEIKSRIDLIEVEKRRERKRKNESGQE